MDREVRRARALASPLRLRILRVCLHEARTNKEIAEILGIPPASCLHHVRTLVTNGFLAAQEERRGKRGAREIPYLATRESFDSDIAVPNTVELLLATTLDEIRGLPPGDASSTRLGIKVSGERLSELTSRVNDLVAELAAEPSDPDGEAWSFLVVLHPDPQAE